MGSPCWSDFVTHYTLLLISAIYCPLEFHINTLNSLGFMLWTKFIIKFLERQKLCKQTRKNDEPCALHVSSLPTIQLWSFKSLHWTVLELCSRWGGGACYGGECCKDCVPGHLLLCDKSNCKKSTLKRRESQISNSLKRIDKISLNYMILSPV